MASPSHKKAALSEDTAAAIDAAMEISNSFAPPAWRAWVDARRESASAIRDMSGVAASCQYILSDVSCTSVYSTDHRSTFWNSISQNFPGIIDFVTTLAPTERTIFFGIMCRLQKYVEAAARRENAAKRRMYDLVSVEDRPSMLYYLCACEDDQFERLCALLAAVSQDFVRAHSPSRLARLLEDPGALLDALRALHAAGAHERPHLSRLLACLFESKRNGDADKQEDVDHRAYFSTVERRAVDHTTEVLNPPMTPITVVAAPREETPKEAVVLTATDDVDEPTCGWSASARALACAE